MSSYLPCQYCFLVLWAADLEATLLHFLFLPIHQLSSTTSVLECYEENVYIRPHPHPLPNVYGEDLIFKVMVFGGGVFGRWFGLDKVLRVDPHDGINALIRTGTGQCSFSLFQPREDTARGWPFANQGDSPHQTLSLPAPWSWTSQPPELRETISCCLSPLIYDILL